MTSLGFSQEIAPITLVLTVYSDGFVYVDFTLQINPDFPTQNVTVFGQVLEDLLVVDSDGLPLGYSMDGITLTVHSLGTNQITITYLTQDMTSKDGKYWTLSVEPPIASRIILPEEAAIISLNKVPEIIETQSNKVTLLMNLGLTEVTYVIGVIGTQEHAQIVLDDAQAIITQIHDRGIIVTQAETKLQEAISAFNFGNYAEAETLGAEAKTLAILINQTATQAQAKMVEAENAISAAQNQEQNTELDYAQNLLSQAHTEYDQGNYSEALSLATQAMEKADDSKFFVSENFPTFEVAGIIVVLVAAGLFVVFLKSKKKTKIVKSEPKKRNINLERIFIGHKDLLHEEKQAIQFLADNNGEAFEADLYDYVKLPRTTTWRMVKRLKGMNIITVTKFRRQNLVRIKSKYDIKE